MSLHELEPETLVAAAPHGAKKLIGTTEVVVTARRTPGPGRLVLDGTPVGAPPRAIRVGPGMHTLRWTPNGGETVERSVHVRQGEQEYVDL